MRDSDPQKWIYKEHTRVKHELLDKYLYGWLWILGTRHPRLLIVDGFAGRGEYEDGSKGSPLIILEKAARLVEQKRVDEVWCVFVERNQENIENLNKVLKAQWADHEGVRVFGPYGEPFEDVAKKVITKLGAGMPPSFWFVDPFGFTGISFEILSTIMSLRRSELFVNLMLRDIHRFLEHPELSSSFDRLFGSPDWRELTGPSGAREGQILELRDFYARRMRSIGCKVTVFRVASDKNSHTLYCLVHATKSCAGRWLMKDIMNSQGTQGVFEYLGPDDKAMKLQGALLPVDNTAGLKVQLVEKFRGRMLSYERILEECCDDNDLRKTNYHQALQQLRAENKVFVMAVTSKTERGLQGKDKVSFPS